MDKLAQSYKLCYQLLFSQANDVLKAKLLTIKEDPESSLNEDRDVKDFAKSVIDLTELPDTISKQT